jgi:hypothetical protein
MLKAASTCVNCNSHLLGFRFPQPFRRQSQPSGQGSENHPDFRSSRKAFSEVISESFSSGGEGT